MTEEQTAAVLEFDDIQGPCCAIVPFPTSGPISCCVSTTLRTAGRCWLLVPRVATAANWQDPPDKVWINVALTFQGLKALGVPQASLELLAGVPTRHGRTCGGNRRRRRAPRQLGEAFWHPRCPRALAYHLRRKTALEHRLELAPLTCTTCPACPSFTSWTPPCCQPCVRTSATATASVPP